jgi:hypothetical protein
LVSRIAQFPQVCCLGFGLPGWTEHLGSSRTKCISEEVASKHIAICTYHYFGFHHSMQVLQQAA